jgi:acetyl esterase
VDRLDPVVRAAATTRANLAPEMLGATRESLNQRRRAAVEHTDTTGVRISAEVAGSVSVRIYRGGPARAPAVVYCHAGAFVQGNLDIDHRQYVELARRGQCTVVSIDYRLAPEHPYPAALDDAVAVLKWVGANASGLDIEVSRVAVAGSSAGAALAACLAQRPGAGLVFQLLHQPVLDDRATASKTEFSDTPAFDGPAAELMWRHYLGSAPPSADAVPARCSQLAGMAPALITCAEIDPLRDEALDYAARLLRAGVATELHVFPGTCHGFDSLLPDWATSEQLFALQGQALRQVFYRA